jgi:hypothetical protein
MWVMYLLRNYCVLKINPVGLYFIWAGYIFLNDTGCEWAVMNHMGHVDSGRYINLAMSSST